jgi:hypothetical protein
VNAAPPVSPPAEIPIRATVSEAWRLLFAFPRAVVLPSLVIQVPAAIVIGFGMFAVYHTVFADEPFLRLEDMTRDTHAGLAFLVIVIVAVQALVGQVARAATVVAVAAAASGRPKPLVESLDPAFTRMGAVFLQAVVLGGIGAALIFSGIGIFLFPYVAGRLAVSTEVMMLEQQRPLSSLGGSWRLLSRRVFRLLAVILLSTLLCVGPLLALLSLDLAVAGSRNQEIVLSGIVTIVQSLLITPVLALLTAAITLFYLKAKEADLGKRPA